MDGLEDERTGTISVFNGPPPKVLIANDEAFEWPEGKVVEHFNPYRQMFGWVWNGRRHVVMGGVRVLFSSVLSQEYEKDRLVTELELLRPPANRPSTSHSRSVRASATGS